MSDAMAQRHLIVEFRCAAEHAAQVKGLLIEFIEPARGEDGCLYYDLYENSDDPTRFFILDGWRDDACVERHGRHPNVARVLERLTPLLSAPVSIVLNSAVSKPA